MTTTTSAPFAELAAALRGDLVTPGDDASDAARLAAEHGSVALLARCHDDLAAQHGSVALLARCHDDLMARGVPVVPFGVPPTPVGPGADTNGSQTPRS